MGSLIFGSVYIILHFFLSSEEKKFCGIIRLSNILGPGVA